MFLIHVHDIEIIVDHIVVHSVTKLICVKQFTLVVKLIQISEGLWLI
jgi:hypothetical protein